MKIHYAIMTAWLASAAAAHAETPPPAPGGERPAHTSMQDRFQQADTDGDGAISKGEFLAQAEANFAKMDGNGDGKITADEREAMKEKWKAMHKEGGGGAGMPPQDGNAPAKKQFP